MNGNKYKIFILVIFITIVMSHYLFSAFPTAYVDFTHATIIQSNITFTINPDNKMTNISGFTCILTRTNYANLFFNISDSFAFQQTNDNNCFSITIYYLDKINPFSSEGGKVIVDYDSEAQPYTITNTSMYNTLKWTNYTFYLHDAYFGNRTVYGPALDFVIKGDTSLAIRYVQVQKITNTAFNPTKIKIFTDNEMGVGTHNKVFLKAMNDLNIPTTNYNGTATINAGGFASLNPNSTTVAIQSGIGEFYISDGNVESINLSANASGLTSDSMYINFLLLYGFNNSKSVNTVLNQTIQQNGLYLLSSVSNFFIGQRYCRRTALGTDWTGMNFNIDDGFVLQRSFNDSYIYQVIIDYYDEIYSGNPELEIKCLYDGVQSAFAESLQVIFRTNSLTWKNYTFELSDGYFGNRHDAGDVEIKSRWPVYLSDVRVSKVNYRTIDSLKANQINFIGGSLIIDENASKTSFYLIPYIWNYLPNYLSSQSKNLKYLNGVEFIVANMSQEKVNNFYFTKTVQLMLSYSNANLQGVNQNNLAIYHYNEQSKNWEKIGGQINTIAKTITANIYQLSKYAIFEALVGTGFSATWTSNPFSPNGDGKIDSTILRVVLPNTVDTLRVFIYNLNGELIRELTKFEDGSGQNFYWDGKDYNNRIVSIGPYIYQIKYNDKLYNGVIVVTK